MKTRNLIAAALTGAMFALAACTNDNDGTEQTNVLPDDNVIAIASVTVGDAAANTRAGQPTGEIGKDETFGLFVTNTNASKYSYSNVYMKNETGGWKAYTDGTPSTPLQMLWQSVTQPVTMIAYGSGYRSNAVLGEAFAGTVESDQSAEANALSSDFLYARSEVTPSTSDPANDIYYDTATKKVVVKFNHMLSKLRVALKYGTELTQDAANLPTVSSVKLQGTILRYNINLSSETLAGVATVDGDQAATNITMHPETTLTTDETAAGVDAAAESIVVPQATAFSIRITLSNGNSYLYTYRNTDTSGKFTFESGKAYTLTLTVGKDVVTPGSFTAGKWNEVTSGELETE